MNSNDSASNYPAVQVCQNEQSPRNQSEQNRIVDTKTSVEQPISGCGDYVNTALNADKKVPKKRDRKKGSRGVHSVIAKETSLSSEMLITSLGGCRKKVKTTKELYAEMQNRKLGIVAATSSPTLMFSRPASSCSEPSLPSPQTSDGFYAALLANETTSIFDENKSNGVADDDSEMITLEEPSQDSTSINQKKIWLGNAKTDENNVSALSTATYPCTCKIIEVLGVPSGNRQQDYSLSTNDLLDNTVTSNPECSVPIKAEETPKSNKPSEDKEISSSLSKPKKSIFDIDFDEDDDPLLTLFAEAAPPIEEEPIVKNIDANTAVNTEVVISGYPNVDDAANQLVMQDDISDSQSNLPLPEWPGLRIEEDPDCIAKDRFHVQTQKITNSHIKPKKSIFDIDFDEDDDPMATLFAETAPPIEEPIVKNIDANTAVNTEVVISGYPNVDDAANQLVMQDDISDSQSNLPFPEWPVLRIEEVPDCIAKDRFHVQTQKITNPHIKPKKSIFDIDFDEDDDPMATLFAETAPPIEEPIVKNIDANTAVNTEVVISGYPNVDDAANQLVMQDDISDSQSNLPLPEWPVLRIEEVPDCIAKDRFHVQTQKITNSHIKPKKSIFDIDFDEDDDPMLTRFAETAPPIKEEPIVKNIHADAAVNTEVVISGYPNVDDAANQLVMQDDISDSQSNLPLPEWPVLRIEEVPDCIAKDRFHVQTQKITNSHIKPKKSIFDIDFDEDDDPMLTRFAETAPQIEEEPIVKNIDADAAVNTEVVISGYPNVDDAANQLVMQDDISDSQSNLPFPEWPVLRIEEDPDCIAKDRFHVQTQKITNSHIEPKKSIFDIDFDEDDDPMVTLFADTAPQIEEEPIVKNIDADAAVNTEVVISGYPNDDDAANQLVMQDDISDSQSNLPLPEWPVLRIEEVPDCIAKDRFHVQTQKITNSHIKPKKSIFDIDFDEDDDPMLTRFADTAPQIEEEPIVKNIDADAAVNTEVVISGYPNDDDAANQLVMQDDISNSQSNLPLPEWPVLRIEEVPDCIAKDRFHVQTQKITNSHIKPKKSIFDIDFDEDDDPMLTRFAETAPQIEEEPIVKNIDADAAVNMEVVISGYPNVDDAANQLVMQDDISDSQSNLPLPEWPVLRIEEVPNCIAKDRFHVQTQKITNSHIEPKKSIFDIDFDEDDDPMVTLFADTAPQIEEEPIVKNIDADAAVNTEVVISGYPNDDDAANQLVMQDDISNSQSNLPLPEWPILRIEEDPNCIAKDRFHVQTQKITNFHINALHNCYIPNINGNWDDSDRNDANSIANIWNEVDMKNLMENIVVVPKYGSLVSDYIEKDLSHIAFRKNVVKKQFVDDSALFLGVSRFQNSIEPDEMPNCKEYNTAKDLVSLPEPNIEIPIQMCRNNDADQRDGDGFLSNAENSNSCTSPTGVPADVTDNSLVNSSSKKADDLDTAVTFNEHNRDTSSSSSCGSLKQIQQSINLKLKNQKILQKECDANMKRRKRKRKKFLKNLRNCESNKLKRSKLVSFDSNANSSDGEQVEDPPSRVDMEDDQIDNARHDGEHDSWDYHEVVTRDLSIPSTGSNHIQNTTTNELMHNKQSSISRSAVLNDLHVSPSSVANATSSKQEGKIITKSKKPKGKRASRRLADELFFPHEIFSVSNGFDVTTLNMSNSSSCSDLSDFSDCATEMSAEKDENDELSDTDAQQTNIQDNDNERNMESATPPIELSEENNDNERNMESATSPIELSEENNDNERNIESATSPIELSEENNGLLVSFNNIYEANGNGSSDQHSPERRTADVDVTSLHATTQGILQDHTAQLKEVPELVPHKEFRTGLRAVYEDVHDEDVYNCPRIQQFKEWHQVLQLHSYNGELLTVMPYVVLE